MRKKIYIFSGIILLIVGLMIYFDWNERNSSFATPREALDNVKNPSFEVEEVIDERMHEAQDYAYVFFYSKVGEGIHYILSEFEKGKYGWRYVDMFGGGVITQDNANGGLYVGDAESGIIHGLATSDVSTVRLGQLEAELIPLDEKDMKIWIFFKPTSQDMENKIEFINKDGKLLN
jgi:hypothetical protein